MVSNKLYIRNSNGLYEINLSTVIRNLEWLIIKKPVNGFNSAFLDNNNDDNT